MRSTEAIQAVAHCRGKRSKVGDDGMVLEISDLAVGEEKALL
jgi:hypothetical protein